MTKTIIKVNPAEPWVEILAKSIAAEGVPAQADLIYDGGRNKVYTYAYEGRVVNIKAFKLPNAINSIAYTTVRQSKARRSFDFASRLISMGIGSPTPLAYMELRHGLRLRESYYLSEQLDCQNMRDWEQKPDAEALLRAFAAEIARLHRAGVLHKDFSPGNVLYTGSTEGYKFYYIDLNRMAFDVKSHKRLMRNFRSINLDRTETLRLAGYYAEAAGLDIDTTVAEANAAADAYVKEKLRHNRLKNLWKRSK